VAKATAKTADDLVLQALETALRRGGEVRLVKFGPKPENAGLFADEKAMRKTAIERCLAGDHPLLKVTRTEKVRNKEHRFVSITPEGIEHLLSGLPAERTNDLLQHAVQQASEQAKALEDQLSEVLRRKWEAIDQVEKLMTGVLEREEVTASRLAVEAEAVRERRMRLQERLAPESPQETAPQPSTAPAAQPSRERPQPVTDEDYAFVRRFAGEMVTAWQEETDPQVREALERSLVNSGVTQLGTPGERTSFSGQNHECSEPAREGDAVEVVQSGWLWEDGQRAYLLAPAHVRLLAP
jgi:hypothetical protein